MAQKLDDILSALSEGGFRLTRLRKAVVEIFLGSTLPLSAADIIARLEEKKASFNKTTVYRELAFLKDTGIIKEIQFVKRRGGRITPRIPPVCTLATGWSDTIKSLGCSSPSLRAPLRTYGQARPPHCRR